MVAGYQYASAASTAVIQIVWLLLLVLGLLCPANAMLKQIKLKPTGSGAAATGLGEHGLLQSESKIKFYRWSEEVHMQTQP